MQFTVLDSCQDKAEYTNSSQEMLLIVYSTIIIIIYYMYLFTAAHPSQMDGDYNLVTSIGATIVRLKGKLQGTNDAKIINYGKRIFGMIEGSAKW